MEQTAYFIQRPRRIEELEAAEGGARHPYRITATVQLSGLDFGNFAADLLADRAFLENTDGCGREDNLICCLCVTCGNGKAILVLPDDTGHIALAALLETDPLILS